MRLKFRVKCGLMALVTLVLVTSLVACGNSNQSPTITSLVAAPASLIIGGGSTITCTASDPDGDTLSYAWDYSGGTLQGAGSTVTWIAPSVVNSYTVKVTVSDGKGGSVNSSVDIVVSTPAEGSLDIKSSPVGAEVIIDGIDTGSITPYVATHVAVGNHTVKLAYTHYKWRTENVTVTGGETAYINWALTYADDQTLTIQPNETVGKDAWVDDYNHDMNTGSSDQFSLGRWASSQQYWGYIQFDLSSLPAAAGIDSASLELYYWFSSSSPASTQCPVSAYKVTSSWNESLICWDDKPTVSSTATDTVDVPAVNTSSFLSWNITALAIGWHNSPVTNYGVMVRYTNESTLGMKSFYSSDYATANQRPRLTIIYWDPTP